jgi:hypothetical protein
LQQALLLPKTEKFGKNGLLLLFNLILRLHQPPPFRIGEGRSWHGTLRATTSTNAVTATIGAVGTETHSLQANAAFARNHGLKTLVLDPTSQGVFTNRRLGRHGQHDETTSREKKKENRNIRTGKPGATLLIAAEDTGVRRGGMMLRGRPSGICGG